MKKYIKLIRVKHWLKNGLILLPLFFSMNLFVYDKLLIGIIGFFVFSFTSSIVYIINDINDIEIDRKDEIKKNRPLATGEISKKTAIFIICILIVLNTILFIKLFNFNNNYLIIIIPVIYLILNILYSVWFKHKPIIDIVILASGFLLRVIYGGIITNIQVSNWLYLMIIFASFYFGFGKRRNEMIKKGKRGRKVLRFYTKDFLDKNMYVSLTLAMVSYSLWSIDSLTIARTGTDLLFWTIPFVFIIFQLYSLNIEGDSHGDPINVILSDKVLLTHIVIYLFLMTILIYVV